MTMKSEPNENTYFIKDSGAELARLIERAIDTFSRLRCQRNVRICERCHRSVEPIAAGDATRCVDEHGFLDAGTSLRKQDANRRTLTDIHDLIPLFRPS